jgi:hypothetical protein
MSPTTHFWHVGLDNLHKFDELACVFDDENPVSLTSNWISHFTDRCLPVVCFLASVWLLSVGVKSQNATVEHSTVVLYEFAAAWLFWFV